MDDLQRQRQYQHEREMMLDGIKIGDMVIFRLGPYLLPINPEREWHGIVTHVCKPSGIFAGCLVNVVDGGYEGGIEWVTAHAIVKVIEAERISLWDRIGYIVGSLRDNPQMPES